MGKLYLKRLKDRRLSDSEFIQLANEVKRHNCLWDQSDVNHKKADAVEYAWSCVSSATGLNITECKRSWKSLRDKLRYRVLRKQNGRSHSGDSGGEESSLNSPALSASEADRFLESWKYGDCLSFLLHKYYPKRNVPSESHFSSTFNHQDHGSSEQGYSVYEDPSPAPSLAAQGSAPTRSNYYDSRNRKRHADVLGEKLVESVCELVDMCKDQKNSKQMKHESMLANLDRMLSKLPEEVVEDLNFEFVRLTHDKMKEFRTILP